MVKKKYAGLVNFFYELGSLRLLQRSNNLHLLTNIESIADHSQRVTVIAYLLACKEKVDAHKAMVMAAFHDLPESRTGDSNWHQKQYVSQDEKKAWAAQLELMGEGTKELQELIAEYKERKSFVSQLVKDADNIEYTLSLKEMALQGNEEAKRRLREDVDLNQIYTPIGKQLMKQILSSRPNEWYQKDRQKSRHRYVVKK